MASCLNHITTFLFFFAVAQLHVHARESKFFSKVTNHISVSSKIGVPKAEDVLGTPVAAPEISPTPALSPVSAVEELGYLSGSNGVPSARETNSANGASVDEFEGKVSDEELVGERFNTGYGNGYSNGVPLARETNSGPTTYVGEFQGKTSGEELVRESFNKGYGDTFSNNFNYYSNVNDRSAGGFSSGDPYLTESQQGMSDTRYLENGKYFYNMKGKNSYRNAYVPEEQTAAGNSYNANENGSDTYEFDTMEEYYRKQGIADPQDQGVYVP